MVGYAAAGYVFNTHIVRPAIGYARTFAPNMQQRNFSLLFWVAFAATTLALMAGGGGCANLGQPTGGPKDTLPPVLLKAVPDNFTTQFNARTIVLNFDEFVDLDDVNKNLIINPPPERIPQVDRKLRTVTIRIKDTLAPNTTFSMRFDKAIKDVNEGNPFGNYTYVLSTGTYIDSATLTGRVLNAATGLPDSTLIVLLHNNLSDTAVVKLKPRYVTRLNGKGFFRFEYLAPGTYNVFALKDEGFRRYSDSSIPFAFLNQPVQVSTTSAPVELLSFVAKPEEVTKAASPPPAEDRRRRKEEDKPRLTYQVSAGEGQKQDLLGPLDIVFSSPLARFDTAALLFGDTLFRPLPGYTLRWDTSGKKLTLDYPWKPGAWYQLLIPASIATDTAGAQIAKTDTIRLQTKSEDDYGSVKMNFTGLDLDKKPVLQWMEADKIVKRVPLTNRTYFARLFKPGDYSISILLDANGNGVWDTGDYYTGLQPERTLAIVQKFTIKARWENEFDLEIPGLDDWLKDDENEEAKEKVGTQKTGTDRK